MTTTKYSYGLFHTGHAAGTKQTTTTTKVEMQEKKEITYF